MESEQKLYFMLFIIVLAKINTGLHATPVGDSLVNEDLDGKELIKMGNVLNRPLLNLLGKTFVRTEQNFDKLVSEKIDGVEKSLKDDIKVLTKEALEERQELKTELCKLKACKEWTEWSPCSSNVINKFGASTRTRTCGGSSSICPSNVPEKEETESKICEGTECTFTLTKNKFCMRLNTTVKKSWKDAQEECRQDGGHLINIDSTLKAEDVVETLQKESLASEIWIDGTRALPNGEWKHEYGSEDTTFSMWPTRGNEPEPSDDCKAYVMSNEKRWWWGRPCTKSYYFLCEII